MQYRISIAITLCIFLNNFSIAQNKQHSIDISGEIKADHISYYENTQNKINGRNQTLFLLKLKSKEDTKIAYFTSLEFREDFSDKNRERVYLQEGFCSYKNKTIEFRAGKQIINWGQSDKIKPVDNICPVDYTDFLDNEKIGVYALNSFLYSEYGKLQAIFIPVFNHTLLPAYNSRWYLNQPEILWKTSGFKSYSALITGENKPENDIRSNQFAFQYSKSLLGFDIDLNYYNGFSHIFESVISPVIINQDSIQFNIYKNYYRQEICGGSFSRVLGKYGVRAEGAYFIPHGILNKNNYLRYSLGIDRTFFDILGYNNLMVLIQWMDEIKTSDVNYSNYDINHLFRQSIMFKLDFALGMYANIAFQGIYNFNADDYYLQPSVKYNFGQGLNFYCYMDITGGKQGSFYSYYHNNRVQLKLEYSF